MPPTRTIKVWNLYLTSPLTTKVNSFYRSFVCEAVHSLLSEADRPLGMCESLKETFIGQYESEANFLQWTAAVFHSITQHNLPRQARGSAPPGPLNLSPIYLPPPLGTKLINTPTPLSTPFLPCRRRSLYERPRDDVKSPRPSDHLVRAGPNGSLRSAQYRHVWARMRGPTGTPGPVCGRDCLCKGLDSDRNFVSLPAAVNY